MIEYDIITEAVYEGDRFIEEVNKRLREGWQLYGNPYMMPLKHDYDDNRQPDWYSTCQAMIRESGL